MWEGHKLGGCDARFGRRGALEGERGGCGGEVVVHACVFVGCKGDVDVCLEKRLCKLDHLGVVPSVTHQDDVLVGLEPGRVAEQLSPGHGGSGEAKLFLLEGLVQLALDGLECLDGGLHPQESGRLFIQHLECSCIDGGGAAGSRAEQGRSIGAHLFPLLALGGVVGVVGLGGRSGCGSGWFVVVAVAVAVDDLVFVRVVFVRVSEECDRVGVDGGRFALGSAFPALWKRDFEHGREGECGARSKLVVGSPLCLSGPSEGRRVDSEQVFGQAGSPCLGLDAGVAAAQLGFPDGSLDGLAGSKAGDGGGLGSEGRGAELEKVLGPFLKPSFCV